MKGPHASPQILILRPLAVTPRHIVFVVPFHTLGLQRIKPTQYFHIAPHYLNR
jgi:hypothetical protein